MKRRSNGTFEKVQRIKWECSAGCGTTRFLVPYKAKSLKYCMDCSRKRSVEAMLQTPRTPATEEHRKNLSESLKQKWRSGTRKPNPIESRKKMGITMRRLYATGILVRPKYSKSLLRIIGKKVSKALKGRVTRHTPNSKSEIEAFKRMVDARPDMKPDERHFRAMPWSIRSPVNQVFVFKNLQKFIREHKNLFLPEDILQRNPTKPTKCRASAGLESLSPRKKHTVGSWKGWTWYSHLEEIKNNGQDLLNREISVDT